jgi:hypothetical protein
VRVSAWYWLNAAPKADWEGDFITMKNLICSFPCLILRLIYLFFASHLWPGCGTKASVASRVDQPGQRWAAGWSGGRLKPVFRPYLVPAFSLRFCFPCSGKVLRPVPPRKGHRRCTRARSTLGRCVASP